MIKHRKKMHLKNFDYKGPADVYFITICTANKKPYFYNNKIAAVLVDEMEFRRNAKEIKLFCYCIMADHLHILLCLTSDYNKGLQNWVSAFKRYTSRIINQSRGIKSLWQKNFYDHIVMKEESLLKVDKYIVNNPVRKGMVSIWEEYPPGWLILCRYKVYRLVRGTSPTVNPRNINRSLIAGKEPFNRAAMAVYKCTFNR